MENDFVQNQKHLNDVSSFNSNNKNNNGTTLIGSNGSLNNSPRSSSPSTKRKNNYNKHPHSKSSSVSSSKESIHNSNSSIHSNSSSHRKSQSKSNSASKKHNPYKNLNSSQYNNATGNYSYDRRSTLHSMVLKNNNKNSSSNNTNPYSKNDYSYSTISRRNNTTSNNPKSNNSIVSKAKSQYESLSRNSSVANNYLQNAKNKTTPKYCSYTMPKKLSTGGSPSHILSDDFFKSPTEVSKPNIMTASSSDASQAKSSTSTSPTNKSPTNANPSFNLSINTSRKMIRNKGDLFEKECLTSPCTSSNRNSIITDNNNIASPISANENEFHRNSAELFNKKENGYRNGYNTIDRKAISKLKSEWEYRFNNDSCNNSNNNKTKEDSNKKGGNNKVFSEIDCTNTQNTRKEWIRKVSQCGNFNLPLPKSSVKPSKPKGSNSSSCENLFEYRSVTSLEKDKDSFGMHRLGSSKLSTVSNSDMCLDMSSKSTVNVNDNNSNIVTDTGFKPSMIKKLKNSTDLKETFMDFQNNRRYDSTISINNNSNSNKHNNNNNNNNSSNNNNNNKNNTYGGSNNHIQVNESNSSVNRSSSPTTHNNNSKRYNTISHSTFASNRANFELNNSNYFKDNSSPIKHSNSFVFDENPNKTSVSMAKRRSLNFTDFSTNTNLYYTVNIKNKKSYRIAQLLQFFENHETQDNDNKPPSDLKALYDNKSNKDYMRRLNCNSKKLDTITSALEIDTKEKENNDDVNKSSFEKELEKLNIKVDQLIDNKNVDQLMDNKNEVDKSKEEDKSTDEVKEIKSTNDGEKMKSTGELEEKKSTDEGKKPILTDEVEEAKSTGELEEKKSTDEGEKPILTDEIEEAKSTDELEERKSNDEGEKPILTDEVEEVKSIDELEEKKSTDEQGEKNSTNELDKMKSVDEVEEKENLPQQKENETSQCDNNESNDVEENNSEKKQLDSMNQEEGNLLEEDTITPPKPQPNVKESKENILCEENNLNIKDQDQEEIINDEKVEANREMMIIQDVGNSNKINDAIGKEEKSTMENQHSVIVTSSSIQDLVSGEHPKLDLSIKSHSCTKLDELHKPKEPNSQQLQKESLKATNSLPNINKKLINDIFVNLLMNEQKTSNNDAIDLNKINMINIEGKVKNRKYFSGCSNIKNTCYMSYDIKKTTVEDPSSSKIDIVSSGNHTLRGFLTSKNKKKKIYGSIEKMFDNNGDNAVESPNSLGPIKFSVIATQAYNQKVKHSLKFKENDTIDVYIEKNDKYYGKCNGQEGWFPKNYVTILNNNTNTNNNINNNNDSNDNNNTNNHINNTNDNTNDINNNNTNNDNHNDQLKSNSNEN